MPKTKPFPRYADSTHQTLPVTTRWTRGGRAAVHPRFAVVGAGNGGLALAGHLGLMGFPVSLYNRTADKVENVQSRGGVTLSGAVNGFGTVARATTRFDEALDGADVIWVTTPASAHEEVARRMAPYLSPKQIVILNPGRTGGSLHVRAVLAHWMTRPPIVAETQTFLYASRAVGPAAAHIFQQKNSVPLATLPAVEVGNVLALVHRAFPQFVADRNVLYTGFANIGAVFHPAPLLLNAGRVESETDFDYYHEGITRGIARMMEMIDRERMAVAAAFGVKTMSAKDWLRVAYGAEGRDLFETIQNNAAYAGIHAPKTLAHRYITEDVPTGLVPICSLGRLAGVATPSIDTIIQLASALTGTDYFVSGRTAEKLGLSTLTARQTYVYLYTGKLPARATVVSKRPAPRAIAGTYGGRSLDVRAARNYSSP